MLIVKPLAHTILNHLDARDIDYADVRIVHHVSENVTVKNTAPEAVKHRDTFGFGVRVLKNGAWGFAASSDFSKESIDKTAKQALEIAAASRIAFGKRDSFQPPKAVTDSYITPHRIDPFSKTLEEKLTLLEGATRMMLKEKKVNIAEGFIDSNRHQNVFASSTGSLISQEIITCGGGIRAQAIDKGEVQSRSYPSGFRGNFATSGWEFVERLRFLKHAPRVGAEAAELLTAPVCPERETAIIIGGDQLALQVHESIGHPIELDRVLGYETSFAGTSFLKPGMVGVLKYGSKHVNVVADATVKGGLGTFGYDDEGVRAQCTPIIKNGIFKGFLSSCSTAPVIGITSSGAMRADGWSNIPLVRMTNVNLLPGEWDLQDLISDTKEGFLLEQNKSWSIDDKRINFQFATEVAREIKNGTLGQIYKNPVYTGVTTQFWRSCDAVCSKKHWELFGTPNCGKGEPSQTMYVGHGVAPARFRNVTVYSAK